MSIKHLGLGLRMVPFVMLLVIALLLAACANSSPKQIAFNSWSAACESYATSLIALAPLVANGSIKLGSDADNAILDAQVFIGPNCRNGDALPGLEGRPTKIIQDILLKLQGLSP